MQQTQFSYDNWHRSVRLLSQLYQIRQRRWGMRVTVYDDGGDSGDYVLSYGLASTDIQDNDNWLKVANIGQTWGGGGGSSITRAVVATAPATIELDMNAEAQRQFVGDNSIAGNRTLQINNEAATCFYLELFLETTGINRVITMPANVFMADANWDFAVKELTLVDPGVYRFTGSFDGTNWYLEVLGTFI